jgi:glycosyltransferase involved in cell wall biosynthesis
MVGDGPMKVELMKEAQGISPFHFVGHREDIPDLIAAFDIMLIPSLNDGFNLAAVEAMASSISIVATAVGGLPEVVGDGGALVGPGDTGRMAREAIALLNSSRLRKEMGAKGRKRAAALFDWSVCLQRTIDLYHEVSGESE